MKSCDLSFLISGCFHSHWVCKTRPYLQRERSSVSGCHIVLHYVSTAKLTQSFVDGHLVSLQYLLWIVLVWAWPFSPYRCTFLWRERERERERCIVSRTGIGESECVASAFVSVGFPVVAPLYNPFPVFPAHEIVSCFKFYSFWWIGSSILCMYLKLFFFFFFLYLYWGILCIL